MHAVLPNPFLLNKICLNQGPLQLVFAHLLMYDYVLGHRHLVHDHPQVILPIITKFQPISSCGLAIHSRTEGQTEI